MKILNSVKNSVTSQRVRLSAADRLELEQSLVRLVIGATIVGYWAWLAPRGDAAAPFVWGVFSVCLAFVLAIWFWPVHGVERRVLGMVMDVAVATYFLGEMGETGTIMFGVYLFIILGNGLRFGRLYMHLSQGLCIVGFTFVAFSGSWWSEHREIWLGLMITIVIIPFYVAKLADQLKTGQLGTQRDLRKGRREASERSGEASND